MDDSSLVAFVPVSPSGYWKIRTWEFSAVAQRHGGPKQGMRIVFEHVRDDGDKIQAIVTVDRPQDLGTLLPFLDAARDLPAGIRLEAHTMERAPWDVIKPPVRWTMELPDIESGK